MGVGAFLDELIEKGEYRKCLDAAEQLLRSGSSTLEDLLELNLVICRARLNLREYTLAVAPALIAKKIGLDTKAYPLLGRVYRFLVTTMYYTNQFENAITCGYEYFEVVPPAYRFPRDEGAIWHVMSVTHGEKRSEYEKALDASIHAARSLEQAGDLVGTLRSGLCVVWNYTGLNRFSEARHWFGKCVCQARKLPRDHGVRQLAWVRRAQLAYAEGDLYRAAAFAQRALHKNHGYGFEDLRFDALMLLHHICVALNQHKDALGYALAARVEALDTRLYWKEFEAAEAMMAVIRVAGNQVVAELDQEYLAAGVDMTRYVSESVLKARD